MNRLFGIIIFCLLLSGPGSLRAEEINLALWQRQEAARRKASPHTRLSVDDANIDTLSVPGTKYHFTQMFVDPPVSWDTGSGISFGPQRDRAILKNRERELEEKIAEAQDNIAYNENLWRSLFEQIDYSILNPDKARYIKEKQAELQDRIERERDFIYLSKKRLENLQ